MLRLSHLSLLSAAVAFGTANAIPPTSPEAKNFVATYHADETIALIAKDAIYEASMQDGPHKKYYACVNEKLAATEFTALAAEVVQEQFPDEQRLQELISFFETETGMKLRDSANDVLRQRPIRRYAGKSLEQPSDYQLTPANLRDLASLKKSVAYQDLQNFRRAMNNIGTDPRIQIVLKRIQGLCASQ